MGKNKKNKPKPEDLRQQVEDINEVFKEEEKIVEELADIPLGDIDPVEMKETEPEKVDVSDNRGLIVISKELIESETWVNDIYPFLEKSCIETSRETDQNGNVKIFLCSPMFKKISDGEAVPNYTLIAKHTDSGISISFGETEIVIGDALTKQLPSQPKKVQKSFSDMLRERRKSFKTN